MLADFIAARLATRAARAILPLHYSAESVRRTALIRYGQHVIEGVGQDGKDARLRQALAHVPWYV